MYGIFTYIYHTNQPNVGKYTIHGSYGLNNIESTLDRGWWRCELGGRHKRSVIRMSRFDMWCLDLLKGSNKYLYIVYIYSIYIIVNVYSI